MKTPITSLIVAVFAAVSPAQSLSGTLVAGDTGAAIPSAIIQAFKQQASLAQPPGVYNATTNGTGAFTLAVPAGQYKLCVSRAGSYIDPCHWGNAQIVSVPTAASVTLQLMKGAPFVLRVHDSGGFLPLVETAAHTSVGVSLRGAPVGAFPLPIVFDDGHVRDFGDLLPLNVPLVAITNSSSVSFADQTGAALTAGGSPFQITTADFAAKSPLTATTLQLPATTLQPPVTTFQPPITAKMIHIYTTGIH